MKGLQPADPAAVDTREKPPQADPDQVKGPLRFPKDCCTQAGVSRQEGITSSTLYTPQQ